MFMVKHSSGNYCIKIHMQEYQRFVLIICCQISIWYSNNFRSHSNLDRQKWNISCHSVQFISNLKSFEFYECQKIKGVYSKLDGAWLKVSLTVALCTMNQNQSHLEYRFTGWRNEASKVHKCWQHFNSILM